MQRIRLSEVFREIFMEFSGDIVPIFQSVVAAIRSSTTFSLLLGFLALYCIVLLVDIVLLFVLRSVSGDLKKGIFGTKERPLASPRSLDRSWSKIVSRAKGKSVSEYKLAVLEADAFADRALSEMGYSGADLGERLDTIPPRHFVALPALREAHEVRNRIVLSRDFVLDRAETERVLDLYREFLEEAEILSS